MHMNLLTVGGNPKIIKSDNANLGYLSATLHLAPSNISGYNVCAYSSRGCMASCLFYAGRGRYSKIQDVRIRRTKLFKESRKLFTSLLYADLYRFSSRCHKLGLKSAVRLNCTSDVAWEVDCPSLFTSFPQIQFYDYCKSPYRYIKFLNRKIGSKFPPNYYLVFSRSETNEQWCKRFLKWGGKVCVVFSQIPSKFWNYKVENGDLHDLRFLDKRKVIGVTAKGRAKHDLTGFVVRS